MGFILATPTSDRYPKLPYNARSLEKFPLSDAYIENMFIDTNGSYRYTQEYIPSAQTSNFLGGLGFVDPATAITLSLFAKKILGKLLGSSPTVKIENMSEWDNQILKKGTPPTQQGKFMIWGTSVPKTHVKVALIFSQKSLLNKITSYKKWQAFRAKVKAKVGEDPIWRFEPRKPVGVPPGIKVFPPPMSNANLARGGIMSVFGYSNPAYKRAKYFAIHVKPPETPGVVPFDPVVTGAPRGFDMKLLLIPAGVVFVGGLAYLLLKK